MSKARVGEPRKVAVRKIFHFMHGKPVESLPMVLK